MPKVTIDHESCIACGVCASVAPEIFEANEEGKSILVEKFRTSSVSYTHLTLPTN